MNYVAMANTDIQHAAIHQLLQLYMLYKRLYMLHALHYAACRVYNPYTVYIAIHRYTSLYIAIHIQHYTAYTLYIAIHSPSVGHTVGVAGSYLIRLVRFV